MIIIMKNATKMSMLAELAEKKAQHRQRHVQHYFYIDEGKYERNIRYAILMEAF